MSFDLAKPRILVARVAETTNQEPLQRVALQFESSRDGRADRLLEFLQFNSLGNQAFDNPAGDAPPLPAYAIAQLWYPGSIGTARALHGFGRNIETRHDARELAYKIQ